MKFINKLIIISKRTQQSTNPISILAASEIEEDRNKIQSILSEHDDLYIAGIEKDESGALIKLERLKPQILVLAESPRIDWTRYAPMIRRRSASTAIILVSEEDDNDYAASALRAGISAFMLKTVDMDKLVHIVNTVLLGGLFLTDSVIRRAMDVTAMADQLPKMPNSLSFSPVERGIVSCLARGLSDEETAMELNYSPGTVRNCITAIRRKTGQKNRIQIVNFSLANGLIDRF